MDIVEPLEALIYMTHSTRESIMKAIRIHTYGDINTLRYEDAPLPEPGLGEVRVRVHATAVNPVD
jgi:D-arabinose 1-dehydrogenase-like Zn-dependent alcohol dehydrogenase